MNLSLVFFVSFTCSIFILPSFPHPRVLILPVDSCTRAGLGWARLPNTKSVHRPLLITQKSRSSSFFFFQINRIKTNRPSLQTSLDRVVVTLPGHIPNAPSLFFFLLLKFETFQITLNRLRQAHIKCRTGGNNCTTYQMMQKFIDCSSMCVWRRSKYTRLDRLYFDPDCLSVVLFFLNLFERAPGFDIKFVFLFFKFHEKVDVYLTDWI